MKRLSLGASLFFLSLFAAAASAASRPNVLVIAIQGLRADRWGCYGNKKVRTPHLDRLAERGVRFENAYSHSADPVSSYMTLFTSLHPLSHQIIGGSYAIPSDKLPLMLAEVFRRSGYRTAAFGLKDKVGPDFGFDKGFGDADDGGLDRAAGWLIGNSAQPYFLFAHTSYLTGYVWSNFRDKEEREDFRDRSLSGAREHPHHGRLAEDYEARVEESDARVGALMEALAKTSASSSTIVVVLSDHGESLCENHDGGRFHAFGSYIPPYEEQLRVPLIAVLPGKAPQTISQNVGLIDLAPTLLEWAGLPVPSGFQGRSLAPLLTGTRAEERPVCAIGRRQFPAQKGKQALAFRCVSVLSGGKKLIHYPDSSAADELYDVKKDAAERRNLRGEDASAARALQALLETDALRQGWGISRYRVDDRIKR